VLTSECYIGAGYHSLRRVGEIYPYRRPSTLEIQCARVVGLDVQHVSRQVAELESGVRQCKPTRMCDLGSILTEKWKQVYNAQQRWYSNHYNYSNCESRSHVISGDISAIIIFSAGPQYGLPYDSGKKDVKIRKYTCFLMHTLGLHINYRLDFIHCCGS